MPFIFFGAIQLLAGVTIQHALPDLPEDSPDLPKTVREALTRFNSFFKLPFIYAFILGIISVNMGNGFCEAILEPGLVQVTEISTNSNSEFITEFEYFSSFT